MSLKLVSHRVVQREGRRFQRRVGEGKGQDQHRAVVGPQDLGLADVPEQRSGGGDRYAARRAGSGADRLAVGVLGVGVVAKIEERGVEARPGLGRGLHSEIAQGVTSIQLSLGWHRREQRQPARSGKQHPSFHGKPHLSSSVSFTAGP